MNEELKEYVYAIAKYARDDAIQDNPSYHHLDSGDKGRVSWGNILTAPQSIFHVYWDGHPKFLLMDVMVKYNIGWHIKKSNGDIDANKIVEYLDYHGRFFEDTFMPMSINIAYDETRITFWAQRIEIGGTQSFKSLYSNNVRIGAAAEWYAYSASTITKYVQRYFVSPFNGSGGVVLQP